MSYLAEAASDRALTPLQAAACPYRIGAGSTGGDKKCRGCKPSPAERQTPRSQAVSTRAALTYMRQCVLALISASDSNACVAISRARPLPTNSSSAIVLARSCCSLKAPTAAAPPTSSCRRSSSCNAWLRWCRAQVASDPLPWRARAGRQTQGSDRSKRARQRPRSLPSPRPEQASPKKSAPLSAIAHTIDHPLPQRYSAPR